MHVPFACSEIQADILCYLFLSDCLVGGRDRLQIPAVEPADQKLEGFWVLRGKSDGVSATRSVGYVENFLAEPFVLGQQCFVDGVVFAFWPNIDLDRVADQIALQFC